RIPFWILREGFQHVRLDNDKSASLGLALRGGFARDIDHPRSTGIIVVRELRRHCGNSILHASAHRSITAIHSPAGMCSRSGGITTRQFDRDFAAMSPDPCQGTSSTCESSNSPERTAGRKRLRPGFTRISDFKRACKNASERGDIPPSASIIGRAKSSKVTMVETGLPGRPKKYLAGLSRAEPALSLPKGVPAPHLPKTTGRPGWIF